MERQRYHLIRKYNGRIIKADSWFTPSELADVMGIWAGLKWDVVVKPFQEAVLASLVDALDAEFILDDILDAEEIG